MLIRSALWIGSPYQGKAGEFRSMLLDELIPAINDLPGVTRTLTLWPEARDTGAPPVFCQIMIEFNDAAGRAEMMASAGREMLRPRVLEVAALFDGELFHIEYRVD